MSRIIKNIRKAKESQRRMQSGGDPAAAKPEEEQGDALVPEIPPADANAAAEAGPEQQAKPLYPEELDEAPAPASQSQPFDRVSFDGEPTGDSEGDDAISAEADVDDPPLSNVLVPEFQPVDQAEKKPEAKASVESDKADALIPDWEGPGENPRVDPSQTSPGVRASRETQAELIPDFRPAPHDKGAAAGSDKTAKAEAENLVPKELEAPTPQLAGQKIAESEEPAPKAKSEPVEPLFVRISDELVDLSQAASTEAPLEDKGEKTVGDAAAAKPSLPMPSPAKPTSPPGAKQAKAMPPKAAPAKELAAEEETDRPEFNGGLSRRLMDEAFQAVEDPKKVVAPNPVVDSGSLPRIEEAQETGEDMEAEKSPFLAEAPPDNEGAEELEEEQDLVESASGARRAKAKSVKGLASVALYPRELEDDGQGFDWSEYARDPMDRGDDGNGDEKRYFGPRMLLQPDRRIVSYYDPTHHICEEYRLLAKNIQHVFTEMGLPKRGRAIALTSAVRGEGKTMTSANLAMTVAEDLADQVLLIDGDLRHPKVHRYLGIQSNSGLNTVFASSDPASSLEEHVIRTERGLHLLTSSPLGKSPSPMLDSPRMNQVLHLARERYSLVIIDTPPVLLATDALTFGLKSDGMVFLMRARKTQREQIQEARQRIARLNIRMLGYVINNVKTFLPRIWSRYYYGNY